LGEEHWAWVQTLIIALNIELIVVISITFGRQCPGDNVRVLNNNECKIGALLLSEVIYRRNVHNQVHSPVKAHSDSLSLSSGYTHLEFDVWCDHQQTGLVKLSFLQRIDLTSDHKGVSIVEE
jgi:hypothetical protein